MNRAFRIHADRSPVSIDQVKTAYAEQVRALIAGGSDLLLVETIFDSLNAKAALVAIREVYDEDGLTKQNRELPIMIGESELRMGLPATP